jgi:hypothetical protein
MVDPGFYAQEAGLLPREGAFIVLRLEILASGELCAALVDTSRGSAQVDVAAIRFARARHWIAGAAQHSSQSIWIRWV